VVLRQLPHVEFALRRGLPILPATPIDGFDESGRLTLTSVDFTHRRRRSSSVGAVSGRLLRSRPFLVLLLVPFEEINRAAESIVIATLFHTAINIPPPDLERKVLFATTTLLAIAVIVIRRVDGTTAAPRQRPG
jgi:hypothetical protein